MTRRSDPSRRLRNRLAAWKDIEPATVLSHHDPEGDTATM